MKGFARMLEAVLAVLLIFTFLIILSSGRVKEDRPEDLNVKAYEILADLNEKGVLGPYASANDAHSINMSISYDAHNHTANVCEPDGSCHGPEPDSNDVWVGSYLVAGDNSYNPKLVKLYIY
ncbi:MAG: hypothetical protein ABIH90_00075 [Candidatus Aenigmatarchaeota archaeon]